MSEDGLITLGIDTATDKRSVAVLRGDALLSVRASDLREGGSAAVLEDIEAALSDSSMRLEEVGLFAGACGPGSFTGLRAGLATLKGLALTLGRPVVGVQTLHAVAHAARQSGRFLALIPAGRGEVFAQLLRVNEAGEVEEEDAARHISPERLAEGVVRMGGGLKLAGGGAYKFLEVIRGRAKAHGSSATGDSGAPVHEAARAWELSPPVEALAQSVAEIARSKYLRGEVESADELRAIYVRPSDAELNER